MKRSWRPELDIVLLNERGLIYIKSFLLTWWQETVCEPLHKGTLIEFGHLLSFLLLDNSPVIYLWELERIPCSFFLSSTHVSLLLLVSLYPWPALWKSNKEERSVLSLLLSYTLTLSNTYCLKKPFWVLLYRNILQKMIDDIEMASYCRVSRKVIRCAL